MLISMKLLREILPFDYTAEELAEKFTLLGLEVEEIIKTGKRFDKVITVRVENLSHIEGTKLFELDAFTGEKNFHVITAATNLKNGDIVPFVIPHGRIANGTEIVSRNFNGKVSEGMLCSYKELGIEGEILSSEEKEGILIFPEDTPVGKPLESLFPVEDTFLSFSLLPDRADAFYVIGIARWIEIMNAQKENRKADFSRFKPNVSPQLFGNTDIPVFVKERRLAPFYSGRKIADVKVGKSSYDLRRKLFMLRARPINNIVDITNYILKFYGQPLHAFDFDKIKSAVYVRKARKGEKLRTLDGVERELNEWNLVIADSERPIALAGVMGGEDTEVTKDTRNVFLESAYFSPSCISKSARSLNLMTDASVLFEKGTDPLFPEEASLLASELISTEAGGKPFGSNIINYVEPAKPVTVRLSRIGKLLGENLPKTEVKKYFDFEGFDYQDKGDSLEVKPPSFRRDINIEADLIEEILRMKGYNSFGEELLRGELKSAKRTEEEEFLWLLRDLLVKAGLTEVQTVSLIGKKILENSLIGDKNQASVVNPFSEEMSILRPSLFPVLMSVVETNKKNGTEDIAIFEIGKVFSFSDGKYREEDKIGIMLSGDRVKTNPFGVRVPYDFYYLKGIFETLFAELGINPRFTEGKAAYLHPYRTAFVYVDEERMGIMGEVNSEVGKNFGVKGKLFYGEISVPVILRKRNVGKTYKEFSVHPPLKTDIAVVVDKNVNEKTVRDIILSVAPAELENINLFDIYTGKPLAENEKNLAYSLEFFAKDRTMKREELEDFMDKLEKILKSEIGGKLRKE